MPTTVWDSVTLQEASRQIQPEVTFFLDAFFSQQVNFDTQKIAFDELDAENRVLAPFVSPVVQGRPMKDRGENQKTFQPAYVKPKHVIDPGKVFRRRVGEPLGGNMSPQQREEMLAGRYLSLQSNMIKRRLEWMAAKALIEGSVTVQGEDYPTQLVDFGRAAGNSFAAAVPWTSATADPMRDMEAWAQITLDAEGQAITDYVVSTNVWNALMKNDEFKELYRLFNLPNANTLPDILPSMPQYVQYKGAVGEYRFWVYSGTYEDEAGGAVKFLPDGTVLGVARDALRGVRAFGAIQDMDSLQAVDIFTKSWLEQDPSARIIMSQSAPLIVPVRQNATVRVTGVA